MYSVYVYVYIQSDAVNPLKLCKSWLFLCYVTGGITYQRFQNEEHLRYPSQKKSVVSVCIRGSLGSGNFRMSSMSKASSGNAVSFDKMKQSHKILELFICYS